MSIIKSSDLNYSIVAEFCCEDSGTGELSSSLIKHFFTEIAKKAMTIIIKQNKRITIKYLLSLMPIEAFYSYGAVMFTWSMNDKIILQNFSLFKKVITINCLNRIQV